MRAEMRRCPFGCVDSSNTTPGRPVQLADDDAFGAIDDERPERREQRQLAEIDLFLDDVARPFLLVDDFVDDQLQRRFERRRVGHVAFDALFDGVLGLTEGVANELEGEVFVDVGDREQVFEDPLESDVFAVVRSGIQLQQRLEGARLDVEEVGHFHPLVQLRERNLLDRFRHCSPGHRRKHPNPGRAPARPVASGAFRTSDLLGTRSFDFTNSAWLK